MNVKQNVKQYAEANGMTQDEVKAKFNLKTWNQPIPDETAPPVNPVAPAVVADTPPAKPTPPANPPAPAKAISEGELVKELRANRGRLGDKDRDFLRSVVKNKKKVPAEYERLSRLIERYLKED